MPSSLAALDLYIGEPDFIRQGLGVKILEIFVKNYIFKQFANCFVDPEIDNVAAIKAYKRAGFKEIESHFSDVRWLIITNIL